MSGFDPKRTCVSSPLALFRFEQCPDRRVVTEKWNAPCGMPESVLDVARTGRRPRMEGNRWWPSKGSKNRFFSMQRLRPHSYQRRKQSGSNALIIAALDFLCPVPGEVDTFSASRGVVLKMLEPNQHQPSVPEQVAKRFRLVPNFFVSAPDAPETAHAELPSS